MMIDKEVQATNFKPTFAGSAVLPDYDNEKQAVNEFELELRKQEQRKQELKQLTSFDDLQGGGKKWNYPI